MRSLALSVTLWMLLVALVPLLVMALQGLHCATQAIVEMESMHLRGVLHARRARIDYWLDDRMEDLAALAAFPGTWRQSAVSLADMTGEQRAAYSDLLKYVQTRSRSYESIAAFDAEWKAVSSSRGTTHLGDEDLVPAEFQRRLQAAAGLVIMPPHFHEGGEIGIHMGIPVSSTNQIRIGYVVAAMNLSDTVYPILSDTAGLRPQTKVYLLTPEGRYVSTPSQALRLLSNEQGLPETIVRGGDANVLRYRDFRGNRVLGISVTMPTLGWVLVAEHDEAEAFAWIRTLQLRAFWTGLATFCVVFVLAMRSSRQLLMPMRQLAQTAHRIADGHWQERMGHLRGAEPELVGQAFNSMLDELAAMQKRLVQSASLSAVGELSACVVHEMRNPLSSVKMNLKALRERVSDDPTYSELADIASGQAKRLERMLNDLLQYGKPLELRKESLRFLDLADEVKGTLSHQLEASRVGLKVLDNTNGQAFAADREQIVRAMTNLVDNAIRVSPEDTTVRIGAEIVDDPTGAALAITVWDAGPGIPESSYDKLFTPFFTTRNDGTGLGLANVRKIAELHGGAVAAENLPEGGAKFTLKLFLGEQA